METYSKSQTMTYALIWWHKALDFMSPLILNIQTLLLGQTPKSIRPKDRNVSYRPPSIYESLCQMPQDNTCIIFQNGYCAFQCFYSDIFHFSANISYYCHSYDYIL